MIKGGTSEGPEAEKNGSISTDASWREMFLALDSNMQFILTGSGFDLYTIYLLILLSGESDIK